MKRGLPESHQNTNRKHQEYQQNTKRVPREYQQQRRRRPGWSGRRCCWYSLGSLLVLCRYSLSILLVFCWYFDGILLVFGWVSCRPPSSLFYCQPTKEKLPNIYMYINIIIICILLSLLLYTLLLLHYASNI